jgi:hypothetical protein
MFSIADLLDRAKKNAGIDSDYRLAKVLQINQTKLSNYRHGRNLPNVEMVEALCALSGDDAGLMVAQVEAARAADGPVRNMWLSVAARLRGAAQTAILSVCFAIALIAAPASDARAMTVDAAKTGQVNLLYIVSSTFLTVGEFLRVRLRRFTGLFRLCLAASL